MTQTAISDIVAPDGGEQGRASRRPDGVIVLDAERYRLLGHTEDDLAFFQTHQPACGSPPKDEGASAALGKRITALPKQCWFNARRAVMKLEDWAGASYVEGWAVCDSGLWIEHGWLVRDGATVDPTLPTVVDAYFPGLEFRGRDEIVAFLATPRGKKCKRSPFFYAYGWGGGYSPTMRQAQADATAYALARFRDGIFVSPRVTTTVGCGVNVPTDYLDGYSEPNRCFVNVARAVRDFGGSAVMGWLVSEDDDTRTLIHHCVWRKPTGDLADISPQFDPDLTAASGEWKASIPPSVEFMQDESATLVEGRTRCMRHEARHPKFDRMVEFLNRSERAFLAQDACGVNYWSERADRERHRAHGHKYDPRRPTVLRIGHQDTFGSYQPLRTELAGYLDPALGRPFYEQQTH